MMLLQARSLSKEFYIHHLERKILVLDQIDFDLHPGEFLLITGSNGSGKSTLLRCLFRSYLPTSGEVIYHSTYGVIDLVRAATVDVMLLRREEIGFVTQFLHIRPRVSALELVAEPLLNQGKSEKEAEKEASEWLKSLGLKQDIWQAYPTTFSGGEQQKVNLARALISHRRLLLLDEPTASLDAATRAALVTRLKQLKDQGVAMIGIFHHPEDVKELADNTISLNLMRTMDEIPQMENDYVA
jgi:alpha-D-ribose 1-methylphosphonate 5-triphosphate synthase subunit PhnL